MIGFFDRSGVMTQPNIDLMPRTQNACFPVSLGTLSPEKTLIYLRQPSQDATTRAMTHHGMEQPGMT